MSRRWHRLQVADQFGRRAIVTGANTGLGYQSTLALARAGAEVVMAVRDLDRGQAAAQEIRALVPDARLRVIHLNLARLGSVYDFAQRQLGEGPLHILINNAAVMLVPRREHTLDGFEQHMGVNHLGHFALTVGLFPALAQVPGARVVSVVSLSARKVRNLDPQLGFGEKYRPMRAYAQSKLAVALFGQELQRRADRVGIPIVSALAEPGWSATAVQQPQDRPGLGVRFARTMTAILGSRPRIGARPQIQAATAVDVAGGDTIAPRWAVRGRPRVVETPKRFADPDSAAWLWSESVRLTGAYPGLLDAPPAMGSQPATGPMQPDGVPSAHGLPGAAWIS